MAAVYEELLAEAVYLLSADKGTPPYR